MFEYRIYKSVYDDILSEIKTVEFRLLNEKSKKISPGDIIKFKAVDNDSLFVLVNVIEKIVFNDTDELWNHKEILSNNILNYNKEELAQAFYDIFGRDNVINSKIVGIRFKLIK